MCVYIPVPQSAVFPLTGSENLVVTYNTDNDYDVFLVTEIFEHSLLEHNHDKQCAQFSHLTATNHTRMAVTDRKYTTQCKYVFTFTVVMPVALRLS